MKNNAVSTQPGYLNYSTVSIDKTSVTMSNPRVNDESCPNLRQILNEKHLTLPFHKVEEDIRNRTFLKGELLFPQVPTLSLGTNSMETVRKGLTGIVQTTLPPILPHKPDSNPQTPLNPSSQSEVVPSLKNRYSSITDQMHEKVEKALNLEFDSFDSSFPQPLSLADRKAELLKSFSKIPGNVATTMRVSQSSSRTMSSSKFTHQEISMRTSSQYFKNSVNKEESSVIKSSYITSDSNISLLQKLSKSGDGATPIVMEELIWSFEGPLYQNFFDTGETESRGGAVSTFFNRPSLSVQTSVLPAIENELKSLEESDKNIEKTEDVKSPASSKRNSKNVLSDLVEINQCQRTLWKQTPQVVSSGILEKLKLEQKILQETKFEIITSEASYYKSLLILETHFASSFKEILSKTQFNYIFGHVKSVRRVSESVLREVAKCFEEDIMMSKMPHLIHQQAKQHFHILVRFCKKEKLMSKTVAQVRENEKFVEMLNQLEADPIAQNLKLQSFLLLPFQRFLRMPLLVESVLKNLSSEDAEYQAWSDLLNYLKKEADECDKACLELDLIAQNYVMISDLAESLHFPAEIPPLALISSGRHLVLQDEFSGMKANLLLIHTVTAVKLILFTDYLILADCRSEKELKVISYCTREKAFMVEATYKGKAVLKLTLTPDYKNEQEIWFLGIEDEKSTEDKMQRWLEALSNQDNDYWSSESDSEVIMNNLVRDEPSAKNMVNGTVEVIYNFEPNQKDELELTPGDKLCIRYKCDDGWCFGERLKDGQTGWFPANFTTVESISE